MRSPSTVPRGLGSSIGMTVVISTSQKNQAPELLPRPDPHGGGTSARAAISIHIIAAIAPVKLRERFAFKSSHSPTPSGDRDLVSLPSKDGLICAISARCPITRSPPAPSGERAVASQDHQRSVMRRRNEPGAMGLPSFMFLSPMSAVQHINGRSAPSPFGPYQRTCSTRDGTSAS